MDRREFLRSVILAGTAATGGALDAVYLPATSPGQALAAQPDLVLFKDGRPQATIVVAAKPTRAAALAVEELNHHLRKMTGAQLPVSAGGAAVSIANLVLVGESPLTHKLGLKTADFKSQEFLVRTRPGVLILMGFDGDDRGQIDYAGKGTWEGFSPFKPVGTLYAVYEFLERFCGVRWYLPGEIGEVVPRASTLAFSGIDVRRSPWTRYRHMSDLTMPADPAFWNVRDASAREYAKPLSKRETELYRLRLRIGGQFFAAFHSFTKWGERFLSSHPEYFAVGCPTGIGRGRVQPNFASQKVVDQVVSDIRAYIEGRRLDEGGRPLYPIEIDGVFSVVPNDTKCWSKDAGSRKMLLLRPTRMVGVPQRPGLLFNTDLASSYVFQFVNRVAREIGKTNPEVIISTLAYGDYFFPPKDVGFEPNVAVMVCKQQVKARTTRDDELYYGALRQWRGLVKHLYVWEYYNFPQWRRMNVFPGIVPRRIGRDIQILKAIPIDGEFIEINVARGFPPFERWLLNPAMEHVNYYFTLKLLDDPSYRAEALLDEYYVLFYGPAGAHMRDFFMLLEDTYMKEECYRPGHLTAEESWSCYSPPDLLRKFKRIIERARAAAGSDEPYASRVRLMEEGIYRFMEYHSGAATRR